jgi:uncharacterized cupredoxin-like copper-binding protein
MTTLSQSPATTLLACAAIALGILGAPAALADGDSFALTLKDHRFVPDRLEVPAGKKLKLVITNKDSTMEEFDSDDLRREVEILPGKSEELFIGPLKPGVYKFRGEYNPTTAVGTVVAK